MKLWQVGSLALAALALVLVGCKDSAKAEVTVSDGMESSELSSDSELVAGEENLDEATVEESRPAEQMTSELSTGQPGQSQQRGTGGAGRAQTTPPAAQAPTPVSEDAKRFVGEYVGVVTQESRTRFAERLRNREVPQERIAGMVDGAARVFESMTLILLSTGEIQAKFGEERVIEAFGTWSAEGETVRLNLNRRIPMARPQGREGSPPREVGSGEGRPEGGQRGTAPSEGGQRVPPAEGQQGQRRMSGEGSEGQGGTSVRARWDASRRVLSPVDSSDLIGEFRKVK